MSNFPYNQVRPLSEVVPIQAAGFHRVLEVWEASVRATHQFLTEADIQFFKPLVREILPQTPHLVGVRDGAGEVIGFVGVTGNTIEMLFIRPTWRGRGVGRRLLAYAVATLGATLVDVNEQNPQAIVADRQRMADTRVPSYTATGCLTWQGVTTAIGGK